jgi:hypothetical protein
MFELYDLFFHLSCFRSTTGYLQKRTGQETSYSAGIEVDLQQTKKEEEIVERVEDVYAGEGDVTDDTLQDDGDFDNSGASNADSINSQIENTDRASALSR